MKPPVPKTSKLLSRSAGLEKRQFPTRFFVAAVCLVCLGLAMSAVFNVSTLLRLRSQYLSNMGQEIAAAIESRARGPGRRNNPEFWQSLLDESYSTYSGSAAFLALVDQNDTVLAGSGRSLLVPLEYAGNGSLYIFELPLASPRVSHSGMSPQIAGWRLRIGIDKSLASFIVRQALVQLAVSVLAVAALIALSWHLLRMLYNFLELKAREATEAHLKALGTMSASLAHEIRNPLGAMKGLTQLAQEELPPDHAAQVRMRTIVSEAERLERLVSDLLDFARPKELQISEFDFPDLIYDVRAMLQTRLEEAGVKLEVLLTDSKLSMKSDPGGLRQVLLNVLFNAMEVTPKGGVVTVKAGRCDGNRTLSVDIDDSGPGLEGRDPEELFQPFVTTKARGTGLGLAVSRQITDSLGGSLTLADGPHGGARCSIRLPLGQ